MAASFEQDYIFSVNINVLCAMMRDKRFSSELRIDLKSENPELGFVWFRFHHGTSFTSWGEKITITLTPIHELATGVRIHSECGMPTQIIDWGKNRQNVTAIYNCMEKRVPYYLGFTPADVATSAQCSQGQGPSGAVHNRQSAQIHAENRANFCPYCGKGAAWDAVFCGYCGKKIR